MFFFFFMYYKFTKPAIFFFHAFYLFFFFYKLHFRDDTSWNICFDQIRKNLNISNIKHFIKFKKIRYSFEHNSRGIHRHLNFFLTNSLFINDVELIYYKIYNLSNCWLFFFIIELILIFCERFNIYNLFYLYEFTKGKKLDFKYYIYRFFSKFLRWRRRRRRRFKPYVRRPKRRFFRSYKYKRKLLRQLFLKKKKKLFQFFLLNTKNTLSLKIYLMFFLFVWSRLFLYFVKNFRWKRWKRKKWKRKFRKFKLLRIFLRKFLNKQFFRAKRDRKRYYLLNNITNLYHPYLFTRKFKWKLYCVKQKTIRLTFLKFLSFFVLNFFESLFKNKIFIIFKFFRNKRLVRVLRRYLRRAKSYQFKIGSGFFVKELFYILWLSFKIKDLLFLVLWIKRIFERLRWKKKKIFLLAIRFVLQKCISPYLQYLRCYGYRCVIWGKIGVMGNAKTRNFICKNKIYSLTTKTYKTSCEFTTINTFTGVLGLSFYLVF